MVLLASWMKRFIPRCITTWSGALHLPKCATPCSSVKVWRAGILPPSPALAEGLLQSVLDGQGWMDADQFRDGAVVAKLFLGDVAGAREYFLTLASQGDRSERDFRTRLLKAYIREPEKLPERPELTAHVPWTCSTRLTTNQRDGER